MERVIAYVDGYNLSKSLFPETVLKPDGVALRRPAQWR